VATCPHTIHIRDSKNPEDSGLTLTVSPTAWTAFTTHSAAR
jgi:hypothetical protein